MKSVVFLLMILGPLEGSAGGWNQCNVASLTGHCKLFEDLKAADQVVTTDGFTMPACALISVRLKNARKYDEEVKQHAARMTELLNASEKGPVHPVAAADLINRRVLFDFYLKQEGTLELPLPLQASPDKQVKKIISRNEFERELESALGADTSKKLLSEFRRHLLAYYHPASELAHEPEFVIDQKAIDRRSRIFEQAKQGALNFLKAGRPSESLSVAEREMIARISAAKLAPMQGGKVKCGELGGASYKTDPNEVNISEANLFYPDQSVFFSVLHELAHSIDFCRADVKKAAGHQLLPRTIHSAKLELACLKNVSPVPS